MKTIYVLTLFAFLLVGCATATPMPTETVVAKPTQTATLQPISSPQGAATETLTPPTATPQPTSVPATSTPNATQVELSFMETLVVPCTAASPNFSYSPNKDWVVANCGSNNQDGITTRFARSDGSKLVNVSFNDAYIKPYKTDDVNMSSMLKQSFIPVRWTLNEDYVYLAVPATIRISPYKGYDGLFRLNLSNGKMIPVLRPATAPLSVSYAFQFSPSGNKLAYINQSIQTVTIVIDDTATGYQQTITLDPRFVKAGSLLWSDDEKRLVVSAIDGDTNGGNSIIVYNFETNKNEYVLQQQEGVTYLPMKWVNATTIYAETTYGRGVYIDLEAKGFVKIEQKVTTTRCCGCSCSANN